jgi:hypothetical protein
LQEIALRSTIGHLRKRLENKARCAIPRISARCGTATALHPAVELTTKARRLTMTAALPATRTPLTRDEVKKMLRDAAYVLHLTRRVKAEIVAERPEAGRASGKAGRIEMAAGLGV